MEQNYNGNQNSNQNYNQNFYENVGNYQMMQMKPQINFDFKHRILLAITLVMGIIYGFMVFGYIFDAGDESTHYFLRLALFWGIYMIGFYYMYWEKAKKSVGGFILLACIIVYFVMTEIYHYNEFLNFVAINLTLMLHAIIVMRGRKMAVEYICGWFVYPFMSIGKFFTCIGSTFKTKNNEKSKKVITGLLIALPIAVIVAWLLISSDKAMSINIGRIFEDFSMGEFILRLCTAFVVMMLFWSFIYSLANGLNSFQNTQNSSRARFDETIVSVIIITLLCVYCLFGLVQFTYLTGIQGLPEELTYSEYAVNGFMELVCVCAINIILYAVINTYTEKTKKIKVLLMAILIVTLLLSASSGIRLYMYIDAYGLTQARIYAAWFIIYLVVAVALCAVRLFSKKDFSVLRVCAITFCVWFAVLVSVNMNAVIGESDVVPDNDKFTICVEFESLPEIYGVGINYSFEEEDGLIAVQNANSSVPLIKEERFEFVRGEQLPEYDLKEFTFSVSLYNDEFNEAEVGNELVISPEYGKVYHVSIDGD